MSGENREESPVEIFVIDDEGQQHKELTYLSPTLRTAIDEIRNPEAQSQYNRRQAWHYAPKMREPEFNPRSYCKINLHLKDLQNLRTSGVESVGDYLVKVMFMGEVHGSFVSGTMDLDSLACYTHPDKATQENKDESSRIECASINLERDMIFHLRYVDMLDNPLIVSLSLVKDVPAHHYEAVEPFGYFTLDILNMIRPQVTIGFRAPWVLIPERTPADRICGLPHLGGDIRGSKGMPSHEQMKKGNIMTVVMESLYRLPKELQAMTHGPSTSIEVYVSLPNCAPGTHLLFPGGEFRKFISCDGVNVTEDTLQSVPPFDEHGIPILIQDDTCFHRHWASVPDYYPDVPWGATAIISSKCIPQDEEELLGDMNEQSRDSPDPEAWKSYLESSDPRIIWNSLHRHYMGIQAYQEMLERLSKQTIWPMEVAVTTRKERTVVFERPSRTIVQGADGGRPSKSSWFEETVSDISVIYHGVAFLDLTALLYPGVKSARFACRLHNFNEALFMAQTCSMQSAFLTTLKNYQAVNSLGKGPLPVTPKAEEDGDSLKKDSNSMRDKKKVEDKNKAKQNAKKSNAGEKAPGLPKVRSLSVVATSGDHGVKMSLANQTNFPFIVCQINLKRAIIPEIKESEANNVASYVSARKFPRKKLVNASVAGKKYRRAVLEASAELSQEFHVQYLDEIVKGGVSKGLIDPKNSAASYDNVKKGFMFYLNASGRYLVLREHLRGAVSELIQQKCHYTNPNGFQSQRKFQTFLHDIYIHMVDEMHEVLNTTALKEKDPLGDPRHYHVHGRHNKSVSDSDARSLSNLYRYAQEAFAQADYENCHRIHIERIARSKDASLTWTDFAVMWLSRGDDRLAEIAIREAITTDSKNVVALIIAGVIAGTHRDHRAVASLATALKSRPLCPEILVLLGAAYSNVGNEVASEYFYKKARFVHHLLTGKDTTLIEQEFKNVSSAWKNVTEAAGNLETLLQGRLGSNEAVWIPQASPSPSPSANEDERSGKSGSVVMSTMSNSQSLPGDQPAAGDPKFPMSPEVAQKQADNRPRHHRAFEFPVEVTKNNVYLSKPPALGPCLLITWNVTKASRGRQARPEMEYNEKFPDLESKHNDEDIRAEFNKILAAKSRMDHLAEEAEDEEEEEDVEPNGYGSSQSIVTHHHGHHHIHHHHHHHHQHRHDSESTTRGPETESDIKVLERNAGTMSLHEGAQERDAEEEQEGEGEDETGPRTSGPKVFTKRVGSEYLWTAHLLLKLRLFDFMDGMLARELAFEGQRTVGFLYLRAMSLHLRGRDKEALEFVHEAIILDPENGVLWTLRGHCYYNVGDSDEALLSYEKTLSLPHGREDLHLVYLRFGALCLEKDNPELAKRVFLKRVHVSPTPYMWLAIGNTCYHLKQLEEAETAFAEANRLDNTNPVIWAHLSLVSLALGHKNLAEQSYKWAIRFGLKKCSLMDEIKGLHRELGYGNAAFPRIPHTIPHDFYLQRLGRERPFEVYKDALNFPNVVKPRPRFANSSREDELFKKLHERHTADKLKEFEKKVAEAMQRQKKINEELVSRRDEEVKVQVPPALYDEVPHSPGPPPTTPVKSPKAAPTLTSIKPPTNQTTKTKKGGDVKNAKSNANAKNHNQHRRKSSAK